MTSRISLAAAVPTARKQHAIILKEHNGCQHRVPAHSSVVGQLVVAKGQALELAERGQARHCLDAVVEQGQIPQLCQ